ncbi:MAG TPA: helix-turn-helix transcriptional regulator [Phycisphaerae bacterium]|nr:helix-turn-helix transcriptional regulator [Phycisphaerae bacterium]
MPRKNQSSVPQEIGDVLRARRTDVLQKGLREMAKLLGITPPHLTDIEKGRRRPSDDLLLRISRQYDIPEADLRSGWNRAATIVEQIATQDPLAAEKVPELLRKARGLSSSSQWDDLIKYAAQISKRKPK